MAFDVVEGCSKLEKIGLMYSCGHAYDWTEVDADMRLEELRECDLVILDHPEEMPWFAKPQSRHLFSNSEIFQVFQILYLEKTVVYWGSVTMALIVSMNPKYGM